MNRQEQITEKHIAHIADRFVSAFESASKHLMPKELKDFDGVVKFFRQMFPNTLPETSLTQWQDHNSRKALFRDAAREDITSYEAYSAYMALSFTLTEVLQTGFICAALRLPTSDVGGKPPDNRKEKIKAYFRKKYEARDEGEPQTVSRESRAAIATAIRYGTTRNTILRYVRENALTAQVWEIRKRLRDAVKSEKDRPRR